MAILCALVTEAQVQKARGIQKLFHACVDLRIDFEVLQKMGRTKQCEKKSIQKEVVDSDLWASMKGPNNIK